MNRKTALVFGCLAMVATIAACGEDLAKLSQDLQKQAVAAATGSESLANLATTSLTINDTVGTIQSVTDLASDVSSLSDSADSALSAASSSDSSSSSSILSVRGIVRRQTTPPPPPPGGTTTTTQPPPPGGTTTATQPPPTGTAPPPPPPANFNQCAPPSAGGPATLPCFCIFNNPSLFANGTEVTCNEQRPPSTPGGTFVETPAKVKVTQDGNVYKVTFKIENVPSDSQLPPEVKNACTASGSTLTCSRDMIVAKRCVTESGTERCVFMPLPPPPDGGEIFYNKKFQFASALKLSADLSDSEIRNRMDKIITALEEKDLASFLADADGFVTTVRRVNCNQGENKPGCPGTAPGPQPNAPGGQPPGFEPPRPVSSKGIRFESNQLPPPPPATPSKTPAPAPSPVFFSAEFTKEHIVGKVPDGQGGVKNFETDSFHARFESPTAATCTPVDAEGKALSSSVADKGQVREGGEIAIEPHGGIRRAVRNGCNAFEAPTAVSDPTKQVQSTPPTGYLSETSKESIKFPEPPPPPAGVKAPAMYPVSEEAEGKMFMIIKPQEQRGQSGSFSGPKPPPPAEGLRSKGPATKATARLQAGPGPVGPGPAGPATPGPGTPGVGAAGPGAPGPGGGLAAPGGKCPGEGGGVRKVKTTMSDGSVRERTESYIKKEGECRPVPIGADGEPLNISETSDGKLQGKVADEKGQEISFTVDNPDSENKTISLDAGFASGSLTLHEADNEGVVGEGSLTVKVGDLKIEVDVVLGEEGLRELDGLVAIDEKAMAFFEDTTSTGAVVQFFLYSKTGTTLAESPEKQSTQDLEAKGVLTITEPSSSSDSCERVGSGTISVLTGEDAGKSLSMLVFEDESSVIVTPDGELANTPENCAAKVQPSTVPSTVQAAGGTTAASSSSSTSTTKTAAFGG